MAGWGRLKDEQHSESDARSQCSQRSDLGYQSAGASSDIGNYGGGGSYVHHASSVRSVGSVGSQGSGDRGFHYHSSSTGQNNSTGNSSHHFGRHPYGLAPAAAHMMNGETQFPMSVYHPAADAPKSDTATVCSGSVLEDIDDVESMIFQETVHQPSWSTGSLTGGSGGSGKHHSPPSSVKMMAVERGHRRTNSAGNRLVDFVDRPQELSSVIPQLQKGVASMEEETDLRMRSTENGMGPPLPRALLLQGGSSSRAESVRSFESKADSDMVAQVDTDDCGGSLNESVTDAQSVLSQEEADVSAMATAGPLDTKPPSTQGQQNNQDDGTDKPHPFLLSDSDPQNGRTSPGGTIYRGRGVRRYQGRDMHLPFKRFLQNGMSDYPAYYGDHDNWEDRYKGEVWEHRYGQDRSSSRGKGSRSRSRSRSRSPSGGRRTPSNGGEPPTKRQEGAYDDDTKPSSNRRYRRDDRRNGAHHNGRHKNGFHHNSRRDHSNDNNHYDHRRSHSRRERDGRGGSDRRL